MPSDFLFTDEELDKAMEEHAQGRLQNLELHDLNAVESIFQKIEQLRVEVVETEDHYKSQLEKLNEWRKRKLDSKFRSIKFMKDGIQPYMRLAEKKTLDLAFGKASRKSGGKKLIIVDLDKAIAFAEKHGIDEALNIPEPKVSIYAAKAKAWIERNGKSFAGTKLVDSPESFIVKTDTDAHKKESEAA